MLQGQAQVIPPGAAWSDRLYRAVRPAAVKTESQAVEVMAIPYYAWANREPGAMQVWLQSC